MPYADIHRRQSSYIAAEYLPKHTVIRDPRNMSREVVHGFLSNVAARQKTMPLSKVFRFKRVATGRKANGKLTEAVYPGDMDATQAEALRKEKEAKKRSRASRKKAKTVAARGSRSTDTAGPPLTANGSPATAENAATGNVPREDTRPGVFTLTTVRSNTPPAGGLPGLPGSGNPPSAGPLNSGRENDLPQEGMGMFRAFQELPPPPVFVAPEWPVIMPTGAANEYGPGTLDPVVAAVTGNMQTAATEVSGKAQMALHAAVAPVAGNTQTATYEPVIDPVLMAASSHLPTPRQSVTPAPSTLSTAATRPRPRPKGRAAAAGIYPQEGIPTASGSADGLLTQRKRAMTADTLALAEAQRIGNPNGKRLRKPAARAKGTMP